MSEKSKSAGNESQEIKLVWDSAEELQTNYVNQVIISHSGPEFYLVFGEVVTPAVTGKISPTPPENLRVKPIIKLAIPNRLMPQIAAVIADNVNKFLKINEVEDNEE
jgi:hypothetical protein